MRSLRQIAARSGFVVALITWALIVDRIAVVGNPKYAFPFPAARLCATLASGTTLQDLEAKIRATGKPQWITYKKQRLIIGSIDSQCTVTVDERDGKVVNATISSGPILF